jgi:hypothetical protein
MQKGYVFFKLEIKLAESQTLHRCIQTEASAWSAPSPEPPLKGSRCQGRGAHWCQWVPPEPWQCSFVSLGVSVDFPNYHLFAYGKDEQYSTIYLPQVLVSPSPFSELQFHQMFCLLTYFDFSEFLKAQTGTLNQRLFFLTL